MYVVLGNNLHVDLSGSAPELEKLGDLSVDGVRAGCGCPAIHNLTLLVNKELFKIPLGNGEIGR